jgi:hypothetical protein
VSAPPPPPPGDYPPPPGEPPPPGSGGQFQPQYQQSGAGPSPTNALAIASLVLGILALPSIFTVIFGVLLGIAAIVTGILGLQKAPQMQGSGRGLAITGIVLGAIALLLSILAVVGLFAIGSAITDVDIDEGSINIDGTEFEFPTE